MARETTYWCDFNVNLPKHQTQFHLRVDDKEPNGVERPGAISQDACVKHLCQMTEAWFYAGGDDVKQCVVRRIPDVPLPERTEGDAVDGCDQPGCGAGPFKSQTSFRAHLRNRHSIYQRT